MVSAVLDSGPLIHLAEIRCFRALRIVEVVIPAAVAIEVTRSNKPMLFRRSSYKRIIQHGKADHGHQVFLQSDR
jgi:hypothetical protein